jgi:hypothetical protein
LSPWASHTPAHAVPPPKAYEEDVLVSNWKVFSILFFCRSGRLNNPWTFANIFSHIFLFAN